MFHAGASHLKPTQARTARETKRQEDTTVPTKPVLGVSGLGTGWDFWRRTTTS